MATVCAEVVEIEQVNPHPNAERLEIATVGGATVCIAKGSIAAGDRCVYFPPDLLLGARAVEDLGVAKYLKHSRYPGELVARPCRVAACRLRGVPSFGFLHPWPHGSIGYDAGHLYGAVKYEPPVREGAGDAQVDHGLFHRYTDIQSYLKYSSELTAGLPVRITEKIHGTNSRVGLAKTLEGFEWMAGSNRVRRSPPQPGQTSLYWEPLSIPNMQLLIETLAAEQFSVVVFGEIYGQGVQDLDYGTPRDYRIFDIAVDGAYMDWAALSMWCDHFGLERVPLLYEGPWSPDLIEQYTYGPTTLAQPDEISSKFKDREGCVITPLEETTMRNGGRLILKSVSADYLDRRGAQDNE